MTDTTAMQIELEQLRSDNFALEAEVARLRAALQAHCPGCGLLKRHAGQNGWDQ